MSDIAESKSLDRSKTAIYARVSAHEQIKKRDLARQIEAAKEYCHERGMSSPKAFKEVGSGLNTKQAGFMKLCQAIERKEIEQGINTYPDRLTRFGFRYLEEFFKSYNVEIEVLYDKEDKNAKDELVEDLIAIITSFVGKLYGMRSKKKKEIVKRVKNILRCRDEVNTEL